MTGGARVVNIGKGVYTAADLSKKWLDNNSSGGQTINPEHLKIVKNVSDSLNLPLIFRSY